MKKLLTILVAAVAVSTVFAKNTKQGFETDTTGFVAVGEGDESGRAEYGAAAKPSPVAGLFDTAGDWFLDLDTGDATLWATNSGDAAYFDMNMQFNPCATAPEVESGTKIAVYLNTASNLVVISGPDVTTNVTATTLDPGTWGRLTISATNDLFTVSLNGTVVGSYASLTGSATVQSIGFKGSGALDNYVARTTDPWIVDPVAKIGGEGYASLSDAMADATDGVTVVLQKESNENVVLPEAGVVFNTNGQTYGGTVSAAPGLGWTEDNGVYTADNNSASEWVGPSGASWWVANNWSNHIVPTANTDVTIPAGKISVIYLGGNAIAKSLEVLSDVTFQRDSSISSDGNLVVYGDITTGVTPSTITLKRSIIWTGDNTSKTIYPNIIFDGNCSIRGLNNTATGDFTFNGSVTGSGAGTLTCNQNVTFNNTVMLGDADSVVFNGSHTFGTDGFVNGTGTIKYSQLPASFKASDILGDNWTGAVEFSGSATTFNPNAYVRNGSKLRFNGFSANTLGNSGTTYDMDVELVGEGLAIGGDYTRNFTFSGAIRGIGAFSVTGSQIRPLNIYFTGDLSSFTGDVAVASSQACLVFGASSTTLGGGSITVASGTSVTNAAGKTWAATTIGVLGELVANGTVTGTLTGDSATAVYRVNSTTAKIEPDSSWRGKYVIGWQPTGGLAAEIYGNANSVVSIAGSGAAGIHLVNRSATFPVDVTSTLDISGDVLINNGWPINISQVTGDAIWSQERVNNIAALTGSANLNFQVPKADWAYMRIIYRAASLDYAGLITVGTNFGLRVDSVSHAAAIGVDECVATINLSKGADASGINLSGVLYGPDGNVLSTSNPIPVANSDAKLIYATESGVSGLYLATVKSGDSYYRTIAAAIDDGKTSVTLLANNDEDVTLPAGGSIVTDGFTYSGTATTAAGYRVVYDETTGTYTSTEITYVAQIGDTKYETLKDAVDGAKDGNVITLLGDLTLDTRVEPNVGAGTSLAINLGGHTLTRTGTSGNGSVIDVKSGNVVITNGTINCTQDDTAIVADGVYAITARSGAALTLDALTVTVNSECGACVYPFSGATVEILGGTYVNNTMTPYRYKTAWTGMAVNQVNPEKDGNVRVQRITIYGGSFKQVNPALGDDSWTEGAGTFLASGKTTRLNGSTGYWDVVDEYTITLDANGGSVDSATVKYAAGDAAFDLPIATTTNDSVLFAGWTNETIVVAFTNFVPGTTAALGDLTLYAKWDVIQPTDPWNTPSSDAGVADALSTDGLVTESAAVTTVADFTALVDYITNHVAGVAAPADMAPNQKANAVLCYALNATTIPDTLIESATIDAITQPDASGAMTLTVAIPDVPVGETVKASLLEKVVSAKGGTALGSMSAENVTVTGYGAEDGKVVITVTPKVPAGDPAPTTFFTSAVITK